MNFNLIAYNENVSLITDIFAPFKVDSLKISIETKFLKINIAENYFLIDEYGEVLDRFKKKSRAIIYKNDKFYISVVKNINPKTKIETEKLYILVKSAFNDSYFKGVTEKVVKEMFYYLKQKKIIFFNDFYEIYKYMQVSDIDICIDYIYHKKNEKYLKEYFKKTKEFILPSNRLANGCQLFTKKNQIGLQVNRRENATLNRPFFKIYNKSTEIKTHTNIYDNLSYRDKYFIDNFIIMRYELTLKNNTFLKNYNLKNNLPYFLKSKKWIKKIPSIKKDYFIKNFKRKSLKKEINKLTPTNEIIYLMYRYIKNHFEAIDNEKNALKNKISTTLINKIFKDVDFIDLDILNLFLNQSENKTQRHRNRELFIKISENYNLQKKLNEKESKINLDRNFDNIIM